MNAASLGKIGAVLIAFALFAPAHAPVAQAMAVNLASSQTNQNDARLQENITREVHHQLALLPYYSIFDDLAYSVNGTTVTLDGQVTSIHAVLKGDAENAVKKIEGVEKVVNNIEILPPSPDDDQIRRAEFRSIYGFPSLEKLEEETGRIIADAVALVNEYPKVAQA